MLKNYFRSLYRIFIRNKFYSLINISGLSIGIATSLFILLYIQDELSYDKYHEKLERIAMRGHQGKVDVTRMKSGTSLRDRNVRTVAASDCFELVGLIPSRGFKKATRDWTESRVR